jgi:hypothetical protein
MPDALLVRSIGHEVYSHVEPDDGGKAPPPWWLLGIVARLVPSLRRKLKAAERAVTEGKFETTPARRETEFKPHNINLVAGLMRGFALEVGRRLTQQGRLVRARDAVLLTVEQLRSALSDPTLDAAAIAAWVRSELAWVRANPGPLVYARQVARLTSCRALLDIAHEFAASQDIGFRHGRGAKRSAMQPRSDGQASQRGTVSERQRQSDHNALGTMTPNPAWRQEASGAYAGTRTPEQTH